MFFILFTFIQMKKFGNTCLHLACKNGVFNLVKSVITPSVINAANSQGNTPLHFAVAARKPHVIDCLIENGANINQPNKVCTLLIT